MFLELLYKSSDKQVFIVYNALYIENIRRICDVTFNRQNIIRSNKSERNVNGF